jgi:hypothetical protein
MERLNRLAIFLMFPSVVFLWLIGWSLYWIGSRKKPIKPRKTHSGAKEPILIVFMPEEKYAT